jgi:hypothetical protein
MFASSSAAAPSHPTEPDRPVAAAPRPTATPTLEESCTGQLWEWIGPYWELGDAATPGGLEGRYRQCLKPWYMGSWFTG